MFTYEMRPRRITARLSRLARVTWEPHLPPRWRGAYRRKRHAWATGPCRRRKRAWLALPHHHGVCEGFELGMAGGLRGQARSRPSRVVERDLARTSERPRRGYAHEGPIERPARKRLPHDGILPSGQEERQSRRTLAQVRAGHLAG